MRKYLAIIGITLLLTACYKSSSDILSTPDASISSSSNTIKKLTGIIPGSTEDFKLNVGNSIFFKTDQFLLSSLSDAGKQILKKQLEWLRKYHYTIKIEGYTDERGTREYNLALGNKRAENVKDYFIDHNLPKASITTHSFGKERPFATCSSEKCWSKNRRVRIVPVKKIYD